MNFTFHYYNALAGTGIMMALSRILGETEKPVIACIGSDLLIGDSFGPVTGTLLQKKLPRGAAFVYGTLARPVTAKEARTLSGFLKTTHPGSPVIAVDAAVGEESDLGLIKVAKGPLRPGSGANKRLGRVGDASVLAIVARKGPLVCTGLHLTRLNVVYAMAEAVSDALAAYLLQETPATKNTSLLSCRRADCV